MVLIGAGNEFLTNLEATHTADPLWFHLWRGLCWFAALGTALLVWRRRARI